MAPMKSRDWAKVVEMVFLVFLVLRDAGCDMVTLCFRCRCRCRGGLAADTDDALCSRFWRIDESRGNGVRLEERQK